MSIELPSGLFVADEWELEDLWPPPEPSPEKRRPTIWDWMLQNKVTIRFADGTMQGYGPWEKLMDETLNPWIKKIADSIFSNGPLYERITRHNGATGP